MMFYLKIAAALVGMVLGLTLSFQLYLEYSGVLARAVYAPNLGFSGISHFGNATYAGVNWYQDLHNPRPCPLTIHLPEGELGPADLASVERLRGHGFKPDPPDPATTAMLRNLAGDGKIPDQALPAQYVRWDGRVLISIMIDPDSSPPGPRAVWVGYRIAEPQPWVRRDGIMSVGGKSVPLPVSATELTSILGPPLAKEQGWP
jgi:hypothetical protein